MDEFKSVKNVTGSMSFIFIDNDTHDVIDIFRENRTTLCVLISSDSI